MAAIPFFGTRDRGRRRAETVPNPASQTVTKMALELAPGADFWVEIGPGVKPGGVPSFPTPFKRRASRSLKCLLSFGKSETLEEIRFS